MNADYGQVMSIFRVHGLTRSYFTRKVTGYLDYAAQPWSLEPGLLQHPEATAAGWNGGIPVVTTPDGVPMWDSTAIIEHLDATGDAPSILPEHPTLRFLAYLLDDFSDEWFYRPAVGSRWSYPANTETAGWQIAEELAHTVPMPAAFVRERVVETMTASLIRLGVDGDNIDAWMQQVFVSWLQVLDPHLAKHGYLLGGRPCLADFALYGANAAHFVGDPYCRELADSHGPAVVAHTTRLTMPHRHDFDDWLDGGAVPDELVAVVAEAGRHYLPWVAEATVAGAATVTFDGATAEIATTPFLDMARGVMLARYVHARSPELDTLLDRAGVLGHFADHTDQATTVPDPTAPAQPLDNRPYAVD